MDNFHTKKDYAIVSGIFDSERGINRVIDKLQEQGVKRDDISIMMSDRTKDRYSTLQNVSDIKDASKAPEGATTGGIAGGALGALIGALTIAGSVAIPGAGLLIAGPIIGALTGGAVGAATGGLIGALIGAGIPEHEAKYYEEKLKDEGNVLLLAHVPRNLLLPVKDVFRDCGAHDMDTRQTTLDRDKYQDSHQGRNQGAFRDTNEEEFGHRDREYQGKDREVFHEDRNRF